MAKISEIRNVLGTVADSIGRRKDGAIVVRRSFFYRHGMDSNKFREVISQALVNANIPFSTIETDEIWKPFRGGASVAQNSHWLAVIR